MKWQSLVAESVVMCKIVRLCWDEVLNQRICRRKAKSNHIWDLFCLELRTMNGLVGLLGQTKQEQLLISMCGFTCFICDLEIRVCVYAFIRISVHMLWVSALRLCCACKKKRKKYCINRFDCPSYFVKFQGKKKQFVAKAHPPKPLCTRE